MAFAVGSLVRVREREWVVLPGSTDELLTLRPLGGSDNEVTTIHQALEPVVSAQFGLPDPTTNRGDYLSCRLLRDAVRIGFRSSAGPFRSFAKIAVEPRPYQLVPLLLGLKLDPVRLLIADDVGIGKTVEAALIARELLDRGEIRRLAVLCPPHLAEQWQQELQQKFHIEAQMVLPSTVPRLERRCRMGQSLFELYPHVIVSTDFIKSAHRRDEFVRVCPEFVIVDEAHTCAASAEGTKHHRFDLIAALAKEPKRHLVLVTATPHSGKEDAFRSLLCLLNEEFYALPADLTGEHNADLRRRVAAHFIQRRRADIRDYLNEDTPFPTREEAEQVYTLSPGYKKLFERVLKYARETVKDPGDGNAFRQRVRWWAMLGLLRSLASSPAAAAATLRTRAAGASEESQALTDELADEVGRRTVLDLSETRVAESSDATPGSDIGDIADDVATNHRVLLDLAKQAEALVGKEDAKLQTIIPALEKLLKEGFAPILFCRFIATADYVATELRGRLKGAEVASVTGTLPPEEREKRIADLVTKSKRVLVCTDCLSEGINLQDGFNAVIHYDLSWNPTRHEQREGRVDRYGQPSSTVKALTYYGKDNQIDGIVLDVLLRKHKAIRSSLGVSVPIPGDAEQVIQAVFEGLLLRKEDPFGESNPQLPLPGFESYLKPQREKLHRDWVNVSDQEKRSQTMFAQRAIKVEEVAQEWRAVRSAIGSPFDVQTFVAHVLSLQGALLPDADGMKIDLGEALPAVQDIFDSKRIVTARFGLPVRTGELYLSRTHPIVEQLANQVMNTALDPLEQSLAQRCGVIRTKAVEVRTTVLLLRLRYHILCRRHDAEQLLLAEDCQLLGFSGAVQTPQWLPNETVERLLDATPDANIDFEQGNVFLKKVLDGFSHLEPQLAQVAHERAKDLLDAHTRIRAASRQMVARTTVEPILPADVLGLYLYLPAL